MFIFHTGTFIPTAAIATAWLKDLFVADDWVNLEIDNLIPVVRHTRPSALGPCFLLHSPLVRTPGPCHEPRLKNVGKLPWL